MRPISRLWLALCLLFFLKFSASAELHLLVRPTNTVWKYSSAGEDLGTAWRSNSFDDSAWRPGSPPFGFPLGEIAFNRQTIWQLGGTLLPQLDSAGTLIRTHYFRHAFEWINSETNITLIFTNYVDDGLVMYLNGEEIYRVAMPTGEVLFRTHATRTLESYTLPNGDKVVVTAKLLAGTNVFAAEVHQGGANSSDLVFAVHASAYVRGPVAFTSTPSDTNIVEGHTLVLHSLADDPYATYRWFKDNQLLPAQTNSILIISNITPHATGNYKVAASNDFPSSAETLYAIVTVLPLEFTVQPMNTQSNVGTSVSLRAEVNGSARFQWFFEGIEIDSAVNPTSTNNVLTLHNVSCADEGTYYVIAYNSAEAYIRSDSAYLSLDDCWLYNRPLFLLEAYYHSYRSNIVLEFDRSVSDSGLEPHNFAAWNDCGEVREITSVMRNGNELLVTASHSDVRWVTANEIRPQFGNVSTSITARIAIPFEVISPNHVWKFDMTGTNAPAGWPTNFDTSHWFNAPGPIGFENEPLPWPIQGNLTDYAPYDSSRISYYFSTTFNPLSSNIFFQLAHQIDDGAIFYLNGQEFYRWRIDSVPDTFLTPAAGGAVGTAWIQYVEFRDLPLVQGENTLAATVKQITANSADVVFGMALWQYSYNEPSAPCMPSLQWTRANNQLTFTWSNTNYVLQQSSAISSTNWITLSPASSNATVQITEGNQFFRLVQAARP